MVKQAEEQPEARMFVALDLPEMALWDIEEWGRAALGDPGLRRVPAEYLHITLAFLGNQPLAAVEPIEAAMEEAAEIPVTLKLGGPVGRPERRPRVVALPVDLPRPVEGLAARLREPLVRGGLFNPEKRPFWPHVTVARVRNEGGGSRRPVRVEIPSGPSPTASIGYFNGVRLSLYRSELTPDGARYVPLAQLGLPGAGGG